MRHLYSRWLVSPGMFVLLLILAACGGGGTNGTAPSTPSAATSPASSSYPPFTNIMKFDASGGLSGPYTITEIDNGPTASEYIQSAKVLQIGVSDSNWKIVTGTFSCASLPSGSHPPITISKGQFDLFVNQVP